MLIISAPPVATEIRGGPTQFLSLTAAGVNTDLAPVILDAATRAGGP